MLDRVMRVLALACFCLVSGCEEPDHWSFSSNHGKKGGTVVVVRWSDGPADSARSLVVEVDRVGLGHVALPVARERHDLVALRNGLSAVLAGGEVPQGRYPEIRIELARAELDGVSLPLASRVLAVAGPFVIEGPEAEILLDVDLRGSLVLSGGRSSFAPRARLLDPEGGFVAGFATHPGAVVSAQRDGREAAAARVESDGWFRLGPLPPGPCTLVATAPGCAIAACEAVVPSSGHALDLPPAAQGVLRVAHSGEAAVLRDGLVVARAACDGAVSFALPAGLYDVERRDVEGRVVSVDRDVEAR